MLLLIAKRYFVKTLSAADYRTTEYSAIFPVEGSNVQRDLPSDTTLQVLFNALDI